MESQIDDVLATLTISYDQDRYALVYSAYGMLDNVKVSFFKNIFFNIFNFKCF